MYGSITGNMWEAMPLVDLIFDMVRSLGFKAKMELWVYMEDLASFKKTIAEISIIAIRIVVLIF